MNTACWGEGGNGANGQTNNHGGGGGGGGAYGQNTAVPVTASSVYSFTIGSGGSGTDTTFTGDSSTTVTAAHGTGGSGASHGTGGAAGSAPVVYAGGNGGNGSSGTGNRGGGGGGGSAGASSGGGAGGAGSNIGGGASGSAGSGGGAAGGNGAAPTGVAVAGSAPGGGGGGGRSTAAGFSAGAGGAAGQVALTYTAALSGTAVLSGTGTLTAAGAIAGAAALAGVGTLAAAQSGHGTAALAGVGTLTASATQRPVASLTGVGTLTATGGLPAPAVVNQWANSYGQGTTFGSITSSLQSCVVPLNPASSVGGGSGTPTAGNWLFAIASWTQDPAIINVHTGTSDDTHQWWREFPASGPGDNVRTAVAYVPNIGTGSSSSIVPQYVYCAPDGAVAAINVLVVEISGLGPWDTVTSTDVNYTAAGTSLSLTGTASGQTLFIGGAGGDNVASGQAFAPAGWTTLATQTQTNGADTTCDNILTSAFLPSTGSNPSVSATASTSEDISGFLLGVKVSAATPIPAAQNPDWPYTLFEAAFGAGFNTPNSELTWTDLTTRLWSWDETTGIQYQLGQLQSTDARLELDNYDGALTPPSPASPAWSFTATGTPSTHSYFTVTTAQSASITVGDGFTDTANPGTLFTVTGIGAPSGGNVSIAFTPAATSVMASPDVVSRAALVTGVPIRLRMALGTLGGLQVNRWRVIQRNVNEVEEEITEAYRRYLPVTATDLWSAMSSVPPTFYRSEIYEDGPYAWWPMDDQPGEGGVLPTTLLNAAAGNTNVLQIQADPGGATAQDTYGFNGADVTAKVISNAFFAGGAQVTPPAGSIPTYATGSNAGWMYGDPPSATSSISAAGNPVEASPGSASWQQSGLLGTGGSNGWYLICNDPSFPALSGGITVKGWFNVGVAGSGSGYAYFTDPNMTSTSLYGQPLSPVTICELATASAPVCVLQLDNSGHLNLITYNGGTGTSHSVWSASDLRNGTWTAVDITLTTTTWEVRLNGGVTAAVSGSATGMTSAWTYLILCGDFGTAGGTTPSSLEHGGNMSLSHWAVFPYILPAWRILSHYTAAVTGFGLLPAPVAGQASPVSSPPVNVSLATPAAGWQATNDSSYQTTPDGQYYDGSYGDSGNRPALFGYSLVVTANAGTYSSGPSARAIISGLGQVIGDGSSPVETFNTYGDALWLSWTGVAPLFTVYSSAAATAEKALETVIADGVPVTSGYGAGAAPPAAATPLGDSAGQRIERLMRAGRTTSPQRSIDPSPPLVQAPGSSGGGTQTGTAVQAIQASDQGFLAVDNAGNLFYWMRSHLASQYSSPVWVITPDAPPTPGASATAIPYDREIRWVDSDPQRIYNTITVAPFSPSGAQLPELTPTDAAGVESSQATYGAQALAITSWLQDQTVMQSQANFLFTNYGAPQTRAENVRIDAAPYPAAWLLVAGISVGDVVSLTKWQIGDGGPVFTLRTTMINRKIRFGGMNDGNAGEGEVVASVELVLDAEPSSYY